jgi:autotransporter translocation and assembly factor TamB
MNTTKTTSLEAALAAVQKMNEVASASIYTPDADEAADLRADGIEPRSTLEVTVWKSHRNPTDVRCDIEGLGMEMVGDGSAIEGKCYSFIRRA